MTPTERACFYAGLGLAIVGDVLVRFVIAFLHDSSMALAVLPK